MLYYRVRRVKSEQSHEEEVILSEHITKHVQEFIYSYFLSKSKLHLLVCYFKMRSIQRLQVKFVFLCVCEELSNEERGCAF